MKYGGQGGSRAIKRYNRDARIAYGQSPYGNSARHNPRPEPLGPLAVCFLIVLILVMLPFILTIFVYEFWEKSSEKKALARAELERHKAQEEAEVAAMAETFSGQCTARTLKGIRCRNQATSDGLCGRHVKANVAAGSGS